MSSTTERVNGFDLARSLAILGMMLVHFALVAANDYSSAPFGVLVRFLDGRATALFVVLSGIGITLYARHFDRHDPLASRQCTRTLVRRGLFLLVLGFVNLSIWQGDILRIYGVSLIVAAWFLNASGRALLAVSCCFVLGFIVLMACMDFGENWDWKTMTYQHLWTPSGIVRNLLFDGFRSVFPWTGILFYGMWLGRFDLTDQRLNRRVLMVAGLAMLGAEALSALLVGTLPQLSMANLDVQTTEFLFGTESMPALPLFVLASVSAATFVIAACARIPIHLSKALAPLIATGQMSLTWYLAHIVLGLGTLVALDLESAISLPLALSFGLVFFLFANVVSMFWKSRFRYGPVENVMRRLTDVR